MVLLAMLTGELPWDQPTSDQVVALWQFFMFGKIYIGQFKCKVVRKLPKL